jgi:predicted ABC-type transport system involved in lysophospholipase L1 biosynthesis ATPase subunit
MDLLLNVRRSRASTLVLVTHDAELASLADTRLVLRDGRAVQQGDAPLVTTPAEAAR